MKELQGILHSQNLRNVQERQEDSIDPTAQIGTRAPSECNQLITINELGQNSSSSLSSDG